MSSERSDASSAVEAGALEGLTAGCRNAVNELISARVGVAGAESKLGIDGVLAQWSSVDEFMVLVERLTTKLAATHVFAGLSRTDTDTCVQVMAPLITWTADPAAFLRLLSTDVTIGNDHQVRSWDDRPLVGIALNQVAEAWDGVMTETAAGRSAV